MADIYLRSTTGSDGNSGLTSWANAKATLQAALTAAGAGGTVYVSQAHNETAPSGLFVVTSPGTFLSPVRVMCVNDSAAPPTAPSTGAAVGGSNGWGMELNGVAYYQGMRFIADRSALNFGATVAVASAVGSQIVLENCILEVQSAGASSGFVVGGVAAFSPHRYAEFRDVTLKFNAVGGRLTANCPMRWQGGSVDPAGASPTVLLGFGGTSDGTGGTVDIVAVNLSHLGSGKSLVDIGSSPWGRALFRDCSIGSGVSLTTGSRSHLAGPVAKMINCDSADTTTRMQLAPVGGNIYSDTAVTVPGGPPVSWRMVSNANVREAFLPLVTDWMSVWNEAVGSPVTLTVEIVHDSATALTDAQVWLEVEYLGTAGSTRGTLLSDRRSSLVATAVNQPSDTTTWSGTSGFANENKQKLEVTFTPARVGFVNARVYLAAASKTIYVNPDPTVA